MSDVSAATVTHVAVGVVFNPAGDVLISLRSPGLHQGGKWEFPGGKLEPGESAVQALGRELHEELGLEIGMATADPLIQIPYCYSDKNVLLLVFTISNYTGPVVSREAQAWRWVPAHKLDSYVFPPANQGIVDSIRLPRSYVISPQIQSEQDFLTKVESLLQSGTRMFQLRTKNLDQEQYVRVANKIGALCREYSALFLINEDPALLSRIQADGVHLSSHRLMHLQRRPMTGLIGASCHNKRELEQARRMGINYALVSPVKATPSHPNARPMGWDVFQELVVQAPFPVYALGGVGSADLDHIRKRGGHGVAGISQFWPNSA